MLRKKLGILALGITLIAALAAGAIYLRYALPEYANVSASLTETENALATPETLMLASVDLDFLRELETKLYGKAGLPDLQSETTPNDSVLTVLQRALLQHPDSISYISAAAYLGKDKPFSLALVAGGNIPADDVINALKGSAQVEAHPQIANAWSVQKQDIDTCQISKPITVIASKGRIIALNGDDPALIERLQNAAPAARDLAHWRTFRASRFIAAGVFVPSELSPQELGPLGGAAAQAKQKLTDFDEIYLGAASKSFPPGGNLALWMAARSPEIAADKAAAWKADLAASRKDWEKVLPTIAALHDRATISAHDKLLQSEITLDKKLAEEMRNLPNELMGLMFSGFSVSTKTAQTADAAPAEVLDKNPRKFTDQVDLAQIPPYDPKAMFAEPADTMVGPFGVQLAGVRLTDTAPQAIEVEVKATGANLPNVGDDAASAMELSINSVRDKDGKELLRDEPCGRDRNSLAAHPSFSFGSALSATKKIRLQESIRHADIASILGSVKLSIPTRIETVAMVDPKVGDHIEREGLRIEVTKVDKGSVSYRVSGKADRLLHLRAKNEKGELLASGGSFSMGSPLGNAKSTTLEIKGKIASLEFVLAQTIEQKDFPFELKSTHPQANDGWTLDKPPVYEAYKKADIKRDYARQVATPKRYQPPVASGDAGPAILDLYRVSTFREMQLSFALYMPLLKNLDGSLSAAELEIQKLTLADGSIQQPAEGQAAWRVPVAMSRSGNDDYVSGRADVGTGITGKSDKLSSVSGRLWLNVPLTFEKPVFPVTDVGAQLTTSCGPLRLIEIARDGVMLEGTGDPACLFAVRALNAAGKDLRISNTSFQRQPQTWRLKLSMNGSPTLLELLAVKKSERLNYPFTLTVSEK